MFEPAGRVLDGLRGTFSVRRRCRSFAKQLVQLVLFDFTWVVGVAHLGTLISKACNKKHEN